MRLERPKIVCRSSKQYVWRWFMDSSRLAIPAPPGWPIDPYMLALDADLVPSAPDPDGGESDSSESYGPHRWSPVSRRVTAVATVAL